MANITTKTVGSTWVTFEDLIGVTPDPAITYTLQNRGSHDIIMFEGSTPDPSDDSGEILKAGSSKIGYEVGTDTLYLRTYNDSSLLDVEDNN
ncbi:hypothetical protein FACS1894152_7870 [Bacilli bacterium]|nr:hypothetical protein FACS1894152_7870 [Bacilli bacterium]